MSVEEDVAFLARIILLEGGGKLAAEEFARLKEIASRYRLEVGS